MLSDLFHTVSASGVDLYFSRLDSSFVVEVDKETGRHVISIDKRYHTQTVPVSGAPHHVSVLYLYNIHHRFCADQMYSAIMQMVECSTKRFLSIHTDRSILFVFIYRSVS